ncbi:hypothetical protein CEXT_75951 [Caerostris extrusa]|uniref:Uncharacterized protein n=1 Tax=Caerostris extrusa TaxID=172846 RepID=A0AAV4NA95_CAEEX|nr:hypothetical protein CEXT_75951 [Caerostris extrusa]
MPSHLISKGLQQDKKITATELCKNSNHRLPHKMSLQLPRNIPYFKDLNSLDKILFIVKEFCALFQSLDGIDSLFDQLQSYSSQPNF